MTCHNKNVVPLLWTVREAQLRSSVCAPCSDWHSTGSMHLDCNWTMKFRSKQTSTTVTGPVGQRLQAGSEDTPVLDCLVPSRRFHDSCAGYKYQDLLTYLTIERQSMPMHAVMWTFWNSLHGLAGIACIHMHPTRTVMSSFLTGMPNCMPWHKPFIMQFSQGPIRSASTSCH